VQISPANSAGKNAKQNASSLKLRARNILDFEELSSCRTRGCENGGFHLPDPFDSVSHKRISLGSCNSLIVPHCG
jgi:hypothetical protein